MRTEREGGRGVKVRGKAGRKVDGEVRNSERCGKEGENRKQGER